MFSKAHTSSFARPAAMVAMTFLALTLCTADAQAQKRGLNLVSLDQEWQMRSELHQQVQREARLVNDRQALAYLNTVGRRLAAQTPYANRPWDFFIVNDPSVNAFNLPGGLVYVNTGLIAEADTLDQLAGVLAHEIGHGAARHGTQLMTRAYGYNLVAGLLLGRNPGQFQQLLAQLGGVTALNAYGRDAEREADRLGVQYAYRAGYNPDGVADFFRQLLDMRQRRPTKVEQFFSNHPMTETRIRNVEAEAAGLSRRGNLTRDTKAYQQFRARFR
ncbi:MAG TPA: M48 family metallopeptidase [Thermoanaerobaculia bacterium]|nr:M48 family metallopeptidase [Thermoanaerobaculia bacterium]